ncbi:MAG: selenide, water dikinase SelD, partial [Nitrosopumilus sp.]|nr:selenide, water dikinase SelD [Nitrosopumilus sp.]
MAKLAPSDLAQVLSKMPSQNFSTDVLVGFETSDDAGVFRLNDTLALVQTIDFFTPIADEPEIYGRIAAVNSLNDIYAMGGVPISALSIVCYPQKGDWEILGEIMLGGQKALNEENVVVLGGHSVDDQEIKFGYAITGTIDPKKIVKNSGAKAGDVLILTKPIGTGVISTGIKFEKVSKMTTAAALKTMTTSAREASKIMQEIGANGCTDITGFGLLGHSYEMAKASNVTLRIDSKKVAFLPDVLDLIEQNMLTRGDKNNRTYVGDTVKFKSEISKEMQSAL